MESKKKVMMGPKARTVMAEYGKGKLRSSSGAPVTDFKQAVAISQSEQAAAKKRGSSKRTWRGRTRMRPNRVRTARS